MNFNIELNILEIVIIIINIMLLLLYILNCTKLSKLRKNYASFMTKLGKGENIYDMLEEYVKKVDEVKQENKEIIEYCQKLDDNSKEYLKKIGLIRYNAFKDTGNNLSFALAILDEKNNGIVLNGIYSRDVSNIFSKPVKDGKSEYTLTNEEKEAINKAINKNIS